MNALDYYMRASAGAIERAEYWRKQGDYPGSKQEAWAEMWHHVKMREYARTLAKQAKETKP